MGERQQSRPKFPYCIKNRIFVRILEQPSPTPMRITPRGSKSILRGAAFQAERRELTGCRCAPRKIPRTRWRTRGLFDGMTQRHGDSYGRPPNLAPTILAATDHASSFILTHPAQSTKAGIGFWPAVLGLLRCLPPYEWSVFGLPISVRSAPIGVGKTCSASFRPALLVCFQQLSSLPP